MWVGADFDAGETAIRAAGSVTVTATGGDVVVVVETTEVVVELFGAAVVDVAGIGDGIGDGIGEDIGEGIGEDELDPDGAAAGCEGTTAVDVVVPGAASKTGVEIAGEVEAWSAAAGSSTILVGLSQVVRGVDSRAWTSNAGAADPLVPLRSKKPAMSTIGAQAPAAQRGRVARFVFPASTFPLRTWIPCAAALDAGKLEDLRPRAR